MRPRDGLPLRKSAVLLVIIGAHVLLIVVFSRAGKHYLRSGESGPETSSLLFFFELPPPDEQAPDAALQPQRPTETRLQPRPDASTAITLPAESPRESTAIDWYAQAEELARDKAAPAPRGPRTFGEIPKSPFTRKQPKPQTPWAPQEKRAGFEGPLPYVRLGRRCMLMPPFIGCAIGKLPKSRGIPREEVLDRDRDRSSVPTLDDQWTLTPREEPR